MESVFLTATIPLNFLCIIAVLSFLDDEADKLGSTKLKRIVPPPGLIIDEPVKILEWREGYIIVSFVV